jgi:hypothetical protein
MDDMQYLPRSVVTMSLTAGFRRSPPGHCSSCYSSRPIHHVVFVTMGTKQARRECRHGNHMTTNCQWRRESFWSIKAGLWVKKQSFLSLWEVGHRSAAVLRVQGDDGGCRDKGKLQLAVVFCCVLFPLEEQDAQVTSLCDHELNDWLHGTECF